MHRTTTVLPARHADAVVVRHKAIVQHGSRGCVHARTQLAVNGALQNGIAAAAANTGGFGNSYGATAGTRAYEAQLQALAAKVPALYSAAASAFAGEKNDLATLIGMQQAQQQAALENAQFKVGVQQNLDAQRYRAALERDKALRELAKLQLQYG